MTKVKINFKIEKTS